MTKNKKGCESLIGLFKDKNKVLCEKIVHADGTEEYKEIDISETITDAWKDDDIQPQDWKPQTESSLEQVSQLLTRNQHVDRSVSLELLLIKIFGTNKVDTKGNKAFKTILSDLCQIAGGYWITKIKDIY